MLRKILIVDDHEVNRRVLRGILRHEYDVMEAGDGIEALEILSREGDGISAVLLDIMMPVMDGYEVLRRMRGDEALRGVPVIVASGNNEEGAEIKALSLGANDYVLKPYNPTAIKHRIYNTITLRESAALVSYYRTDKLTGLLSREAFFEKAAEMIAAREPGYYVLACLDIDNFKVINDQYGAKRGDAVLRHVAGVLRDGIEAVGGICCRVMADNFAVLYPRDFLNTEGADVIRGKAEAPGLAIPQITISTGRYVVRDKSIPVSSMYDRAAIAEASVKGRFDIHVAQYDESMRDALLREQSIVNEMNAALTSGQFEMWLQPQYNHSSGALIGSEALVRWRHPTRGLVSPGEFIPVFERNGFIYELDKHVWELACALLRKWMDAGTVALPISVNVSRCDVFRDDFMSVISGLIEKYGIPVDMLRLEITESAFESSSAHIIGVVKRLVASGFTVEIDDFGSGYSSLNTLKDVPASVLKLDMRFLESSENSQRGGNILQSMVRMAKWLGMPVIAEGVETKEQADYLRSIGCCYVQGYLYARPMPVPEFEALAQRSVKETELMALETVEKLDNDAFWDPKSMETLIFNSYVGSACIFEYHEGRMELLRVNEKYAREMSGNVMSIETALTIDVEDYMDEENRETMHNNIRAAIETGREATYETKLQGLPHNSGVVYLSTTVRVIAKAGNRYLLYASIVNITAQRMAERKELEIASQMRAIMENINGGVSAVTIGEGLKIEFVFANEQYYSMFGYTKELLEKELVSAFELVHPEDRERIRETVVDVIKKRAPAAYEYRCVKRGGDVIYVRCNASITGIEGVSDSVLLSVITDITNEKLTEMKLLDTAEERLRETERIFRTVAAHSNRIVCSYDVPSRTYHADSTAQNTLDMPLSMSDMPESVIKSGAVPQESVHDYRQLFEDIHNGKPEGSARLRMRGEGSGQHWVDMRYTIISYAGGAPKTAVISYKDITDEHERVMAYERYTQSISDATSRDGVVYFETDLTTDVVERQGGNVPYLSFPKSGCTHLEAVSYGVESLVPDVERERAFSFFSRERLMEAFARGARSFTEDWPTILPNGQRRYFRANIQTIQDPYSGHIRAYTMLRDVTGEKLAELDVKQKAETDGMTGAYNRATAESLINGKLASSIGEPCMLLLADIDNLKIINDNLGHADGDRAIRLLTDALRSQFRRTDIVGRIGGDELVAFLHGTDDREKMTSAMESLMKGLGRVWLGEDGAYRLRASAGIAIGFTGRDTFKKLYMKADKALYHIKRSGKNGFAFYSEDME